MDTPRRVDDLKFSLTITDIIGEIEAAWKRGDKNIPIEVAYSLAVQLKALENKINQVMPETAFDDHNMYIARTDL